MEFCLTDVNCRPGQRRSGGRISLILHCALAKPGRQIHTDWALGVSSLKPVVIFRELGAA